MEEEALQDSEARPMLGVESCTCVAIVTGNFSGIVIAAASLLTGFLGRSSHYAGDVPRGHLALLRSQRSP